MGKEEDDSSSHRICIPFVSVFREDNTHSVVQLNPPSSLLIFFLVKLYDWMELLTVGPLSALHYNLH